MPTHGRPHQVDTSWHFCPHPTCAYRGWVGLGNLRANGHPNGGPWRQLHCTSCRGYFQETHGTPLHGKRVAPEKLVWAVGALAEGLGIRAVARVFEVDPNTVLTWLVEVADHAAAFSQYFLHEVRVTQVQLDDSLPCSVRSRLARSATPRPSSACRARRAGSGGHSTPLPNCC